MNKPINYIDFYIKGNDRSTYIENKILENDLINTIIQKLEIIIFTKKGDLYGDPYLGSDLEYYLWSTKIPDTNIKTKLKNQINTYIPELSEIGYDIKIDLYEGSIRDIMYISFTINEYNIKFILD
jgi:hypothetical protein